MCLSQRWSVYGARHNVIITYHSQNSPSEGQPSWNKAESSDSSKDAGHKKSGQVDFLENIFTFDWLVGQSAKVKAVGPRVGKKFAARTSRTDTWNLHCFREEKRALIYPLAGLKRGQLCCFELFFESLPCCEQLHGENNTSQHHFSNTKGIVYQNILSSFTHPHVVSKPNHSDSFGDPKYIQFSFSIQFYIQWRWMVTRGF